jgi:hypothetical protein
MCTVSLLVHVSSGKGFKFWSKSSKACRARRPKCETGLSVRARSFRSDATDPSTEIGSMRCARVMAGVGHGVGVRCRT